MSGMKVAESIFFSDTFMYCIYFSFSSNNGPLESCDSHGASTDGNDYKTKAPIKVWGILYTVSVFWWRFQMVKKMAYVTEQNGSSLH